MTFSLIIPPSHPPFMKFPPTSPGLEGVREKRGNHTRIPKAFCHLSLLALCIFYPDFMMPSFETSWDLFSDVWHDRSIFSFWK